MFMITTLKAEILHLPPATACVRNLECGRFMSVIKQYFYTINEFLDHRIVLTVYLTVFKNVCLSRF